MGNDMRIKQWDLGNWEIKNQASADPSKPVQSQLPDGTKVRLLKGENGIVVSLEVNGNREIRTFNNADEFKAFMNGAPSFAEEEKAKTYFDEFVNTFDVNWTTDKAGRVQTQQLWKIQDPQTVKMDLNKGERKNGLIAEMQAQSFELGFLPKNILGRDGKTVYSSIDGFRGPVTEKAFQDQAQLVKLVYEDFSPDKIVEWKAAGQTLINLQNEIKEAIRHPEANEALLKHLGLFNDLPKNPEKREALAKEFNLASAKGLWPQIASWLKNKNSATTETKQQVQSSGEDNTNPIQTNQSAEGNKTTSEEQPLKENKAIEENPTTENKLAVGDTRSIQKQMMKYGKEIRHIAEDLRNANVDAIKNDPDALTWLNQKMQAVKTNLDNAQIANDNFYIELAKADRHGKPLTEQEQAKKQKQFESIGDTIEKDLEYINGRYDELLKLIQPDDSN